MPAPVIVMKDVGGFVTDYQTQTALYRASDREVRLHECRSACTLALSLPNVCVYPDSILKFHQAYDPRNHQTDFNVSQQLFDSYPAAVRARLGALTREYKVLRGSELIGLGIRACNEPRVMVASAAPRKPPALSASPQPPTQPQSQPIVQASVLGGFMRNVMSAFGGGFAGKPGEAREQAALVRQGSAARPAPEETAADIPLPPARPTDLGPPAEAALQPQPEAAEAFEAAETFEATKTFETTRASGKLVPLDPAATGTLGALAPGREAPAPSQEASSDGVRISEAQPLKSRPAALSYSYGRQQPPYRLPAIITGSQPILPPGFQAYAELRR